MNYLIIRENYRQMRRKLCKTSDFAVVQGLSEIETAVPHGRYEDFYFKITKKFGKRTVLQSLRGHKKYSAD